MTACVSGTRVDVELSLALGEEWRFVAHRSSGMFEVDISVAENLSVDGLLELDNQYWSFVPRPVGHSVRNSGSRTVHVL